MEALGGLIVLLFYLAVIVAILAGAWKMFVKAGKPGWGCLIPIYNAILLMEMAGRPVWWVILLFIPIVNLIITIIVFVDVAARFGKGAGFGVGMAFLGFIFIPILGFGDAKYTPGPPAAAA